MAVGTKETDNGGVKDHTGRKIETITLENERRILTFFFWLGNSSKYLHPTIGQMMRLDAESCIGRHHNVGKNIGMKETI